MPRHREADDRDLVVIELDDLAPPEAVPAGPGPRQEGPRTTRARLVAVVLVVAVVVGAAATRAAIGGDRRTHASPSPRITHRHIEPLLPFATGTSLVMADGAELRRVDLDTGDDTTARFPQFASGALQIELATTDAIVVRTASQQASPWTRFVVPADLGAPPVGIATERQTLAAAADDRHLLRLDAGTRRVDELDARGRARPLPHAGTMTALTVVGTRAGVLFAGPGQWALLDPGRPPDRGPVLRRGSLVAAGPATAVSAASTCAAGACPVQTVDLVTGHARAVPDHGLGALLAAYRAHGLDLGLVGRVSPDGRRLAVVGPDDGLLAVDLVTGETTDPHLSVLGLGSVAWSADGQTLFGLAAGRGRGWIGVVQIDTGRVELLQIGLRQAVSLAAVPGPRRDRAPSSADPRALTIRAPGGPLLGGHTGFTVVSQEPDSLRVVDADTGKVTEAEIPPASVTAETSGDNSLATIPAEPGRVPVVVDGSVVFVHDAAAYAFDPRTHRFLQLGAARRVLASSARGRVWVIAAGPPTGTGATVWTAAEVDVHSGRTTATRTAPGEALAVVERGLVLERQTTTGAWFDVWDPASGHIVQSVPASTAAASVLAARVRWLLDADSRCGCTRVVNLRDGSQLTFSIPAQAAAFAPDGRTVAFSTSTAGDTWSVLDLASRVLTVVPALGLDGARPVWSPDGHWLFGASYDGGVRAVPLPAGIRDRSLVTDVPGVSGATWFSVVGGP